jgi:exonuclease SbcD
MRLLHTADWHVGRSIRGRSRANEFAAALNEVVRIALDEHVDAVLIAGDVYDHRVPSPESDGLVFETLVRFYEHSLPVVVIPGNHDSPQRLEALASLLRPIRVHVVPRVVPPSEGSVVELDSRTGSERAVIACLPFVPERRYGEAARLFEGPDTWYQSYAEGVGGLTQAMARSFRPDRVNVLMAHLFTDGALVSGSERDIALGIGMIYAVSPNRLPGTATYIALGHVHRPQAVGRAPAPARFAGSLLQLDFGEKGQSKSVTIVEAAPGRPARTHEVTLSAGRPLVEIRGTLDDLRAAAAGLGNAHVHATVVTDGPVPGLADTVRETLPNAVDVEVDYPRTDGAPPAPKLSSLDPLEQYVAYHRSVYRTDPSDGKIAAFNDVLEIERGALD